VFPGSNFGRETGILTEVFRRFPQTLQANSGMVFFNYAAAALFHIPSSSSFAYQISLDAISLSNLESVDKSSTNKQKQKIFG
jgi:hypothetical protein